MKRGGNAGNLVRQVAKVAGGGGRDAAKVDEALAKAAEVLAGQV